MRILQTDTVQKPFYACNTRAEKRLRVYLRQMYNVVLMRVRVMIMVMA